jgi:hypothetical protein
MNSLSYRFSAIRTTKMKKLNWDEKMKKRAEKKSIKNYEKELKEKRSRDLEVRTLMKLMCQNLKITPIEYGI